MTKRAWSGAAALTLGLLGVATAASDASAECLRRIYNRSAFVLVASQDGGPPATILPGQSLPVALVQPGRFALSAYCGIPGPDGALTPVTQASFEYQAVLDRCFVRFGTEAFVPQLGRGFFGQQGTAPFTLNNPRQGDVVLGPFNAPSCPVLSRRG